MLRRIGVMLSVGAADSLNPSTVGPALYLACDARPVRRVTLFTIGVFAVNFGAGLVLTIGPGRAVLGLVPRPQGTVKHVIVLIAGLVASSASIPEQVWLLALYNVAFVLPLLAIIVILLCASGHADRWLKAGGEWLERRWPVVLAGLLLFVGGILTALGAVGLVKT
jgi:hypothetical protein